MSQGRSRLLLAGSMRIGQPFVRKQAPWAWLTAAALLLLAFLRETQAEQFLHEFAGPLDGGGRISCVQYFVLRQEAQPCVQLTSSAPSIQGEVCSTVAGPLLAVYSPAADRNLFTARLVGPQVQMLPLTGCQVTDREEREEKARDCDDSDPEHESVVYGLMSGLIPGLYRLEVQWLYTGFSYGKDRLVINHDRLHVSAFTHILTHTHTHTHEDTRRDTHTHTHTPDLVLVVRAMILQPQWSGRLHHAGTQRHMCACQSRVGRHAARRHLNVLAKPPHPCVCVCVCAVCACSP